jgi:hypothetical protein
MAFITADSPHRHLPAEQQSRETFGNRKERSHGVSEMSKVISARAASVDRYITGRDPGAGRAGAVVAAREAADGRDVGLMGGGVLASALEADLVDEVILHRVPVLLDGGRPHPNARLVTHLHDEVAR